jgi:protease-4
LRFEEAAVKRVVQFLFVLILVIFVGMMATGLAGMMSMFSEDNESLAKNSILAIDLDNVIIDGKDFIELLRKYRKEDRIKGVLIRINSPGGVVGPSQEIYDEIKRTREEFKKPVFAYCSAVMASGAYYSAVAADKIFTTPGCMMGSIGVLMEFVNLSKLYDWAKIERYAIVTGKFKDAGAEYKALTPEQRALFQDMLDDVLKQFKSAVIAGRKMKPEFLDQYADGRIFTGAQAVKLGFADTVGTWEDARQALGELTGLGKNPDVFEAKKKKTFWQHLEGAASHANVTEKVSEAFLRTGLSSRPLFLMPGAVGF